MLALVFSILVQASPSHAWFKIIDCHQGEVVVDQMASEMIGRPNYQLVLRGRAFRYFLERGAFTRGNEKGEFIIELKRSPEGFIGTSLVRPGSDTYGHRVFKVNVSRADRRAELTASIRGKHTGEQLIARIEIGNCQ